MGFDFRVAVRYAWGMEHRSFEQIVKDVGEDTLIDRLGLKPHQPRDWRIRKSIPPEHWRAMADLGFASLEELAAAAEARRATA